MATARSDDTGNSSSAASWFSGIGTALALVVLAVALVDNSIVLYAVSVVIVLLSWVGYPGMRRASAELPLLALQAGTAAVAIGAIPALVLR